MQINNICLFFNIEKSVIAERISANARNADWFLLASLTAAGRLVIEAMYGLLWSDVCDTWWSCCFEPVNNASFLYNGRDAFSGSGTPSRWSGLPIADPRLEVDNVRVREYGGGASNVEPLGTWELESGDKLLAGNNG